MIKKIPTTAEAERWIDPDTFIYRNKSYTITGNCKIIRKLNKKQSLLNPNLKETN